MPAGGRAGAAAAICMCAADIVAGSRAARYGDILQVHASIAALWNAFLGERLLAGRKLNALDVALLMALLKIARAKAGAYSIDDYVDIAGYAGCAGEIAELLHKGEA